MKAVRTLAATLLALSLPYLAIAAETGPAAVKQPVSKYDFAEPEVLVQKAEALAKSDMAKMAAAEMVYRNHVYLHVFQLQVGTNVPTYLFMKLYRRFTGYEVIDVERTNSVLRPIKFTIRFDCERVGTREINGAKESVESLREAESDNAFMVRDTESLTRVYYCDAQGEVVESPSPILARPNFWTKDGKDPFGATSVLDPYNLPAGE